MPSYSTISKMRLQVSSSLSVLEARLDFLDFFLLLSLLLFLFLRLSFLPDLLFFLLFFLLLFFFLLCFLEVLLSFDESPELLDSD